MKIAKNLIWTCVIMVLLFWSGGLSAYAAQKTIYNSPYVTFSPDNKAWTTNAGDAKYSFYPYGMTRVTGIASSLSEPETGQHYYRAARVGSVSVGKWVVNHQYGNCIHDSYPSYYHGIVFGRQKCMDYYYSGWLPYCADCGELLQYTYFYMSAEAADSIHYLDVGSGLDYYYLCPHCRNLEQGMPMSIHMCKEISWNQYRVVYHENTDALYSGYIPDSYHMYNNAEEYEGERVTPITHLTKNTYIRIGYEFVGWNTEPDGSGLDYEDEAEIYNLSLSDWKNEDSWTKEDQGTVNLYAQWRPSVSTLHIDPNGGSYDGSWQITDVEGAYGTAYEVSTKLVEAPAGVLISFETNGGTPLDPVRGTQHFAEWSRTIPFLGQFDGEQYFFFASDGGEDTLKAVYEPDGIDLPETVKEGFSFGGWYYDSEFTHPAGGVGDMIIPAMNVTLYAQWVDLILHAEDNYYDNGGKGAVDLSWSQQDGKGKVYLVYQSRDGGEWTKINEKDDISNSNSVDITFGYTGKQQTYTVPFTGIYSLMANGAQGGNYEEFYGGAGGSVTARFWLRKGEVLTFTVGGQDGHLDGGKASVYANGGDSTIVSSDQKGVLLIAGGGGGASIMGDGGAGGSVAGLVEGSDGEDGMSGGGGGAEGGAAGAVIKHYHSGSANSYGGCYTAVRYCGNGSMTYHEEWIKHYNNSNYYDVELDVIVRDAYCIQCRSNSCVGHDLYDRWYTCDRCGQRYDSNPGYCINTLGYAPGCGYASGQVISAYPAYGGSSYVNPEHVYYYEKSSGVNTGDGTLSIHAEVIGFTEDAEIDGVTATDLAAPAQISENVELLPEAADRVTVVWKEPRDYGTVYYHMVESYLMGSDSLLCKSNMTMNILTSGVVGYYCLTDSQPATTVSEMNGIYTTEPCWTIRFEDEDASAIKYLHIAAVDLAGNLGETTHIRVERAGGDVAWRLFTEPLALEDGDNIYPAGEGAWYVKSDGVTPFALNYRAYMEGTASLAYQPNYVIFESNVGGEVSRNVIQVPSQDIPSSGSLRTSAEKLRYSQQDQPPLTVYPYSMVVRSDQNRALEACQKFTLDSALSGTEIFILPVAGADRKGSIVYSDHDRDAMNGITVIADGEAPEISGLELLENMELIDRRVGSLTLAAHAADNLSGVREFYISVANRDNAVEKTYYPGENGYIYIEITRDEPVFSGDFAVTAFAADNVGNTVQISYGTTEFSLEVQVERILEPHTPVFKNGESGMLTFSVWGYADRVEVEFPEEMTNLVPELNRTFVYTGRPAYVQTEQIQFMIPLGTPLNEHYTITVRAYKGDRKLEEYPSVSLVGVDGTVLDEFRTRLR